jgi:hypothetical protein
MERVLDYLLRWPKPKPRGGLMKIVMAKRSASAWGCAGRGSALEAVNHSQGPIYADGP